MGYDVKMFVICNHIINNKNYLEHQCPRCYGSGFYFDIFFNKEGYVVTSENSIKLTQELLKIIIENKGSNIFHPQWGCDVYKKIGDKKMTNDKLKIEISVRQAIEYLKNLQQTNLNFSANTREEEMIDSIESVKVEDDGNFGYTVSVSVVSKAGEKIKQSVKIK